VGAVTLPNDHQERLALASLALDGLSVGDPRPWTR